MRLAVPVSVLLCVADALLLREALPVAEGEAPREREEVGDCEVVVLSLTVLLGVTVAVPVPLPVCVMVELAVGVCAAEGEPLREMLALVEGDAPGVRDAVAEDDTVEEALCVEEGVDAPVPLLVAVGGLDGVPVAV